jgi:hypothetical protein
MKIQTLKDIKEVLKDISDEDLEKLGFGVGEGSEETVSLCAYCSDMDDGTNVWLEMEEKYPVIRDIDKWFKNLVKAQEHLDAQEEKSKEIQEMDRPISSEDSF